MAKLQPFSWRRWTRRAACPLALMLPGGPQLLPARRPLPIRHTPCPTGVARELLVFLPGMDELPGDFLRHGFGEAAWRAGVAADVAEPDLHLGYFLRGLAVESLHEHVVRPALARGYERIWLVGLSLGGFAALRYAETHGDSVDGVVLLAPLLGRGRVGGTLWQAPREQSELPGAPRQERLWQWLPHRHPHPPLYLAFGDGDPSAPTHRLLAELLPRGNVFSTAGGHTWTTWSHLWTTLLSRVLTQPRHV